MQAMLRTSQAKGLDRAVIAAVASYANAETGLAFPSNDLLMREWGFSERRIQTALRNLEELGELRRQPQEESFQRRRVYIVGSGQLSILDVGAELRAPTSVRPHDMPAPAQMPSRVKGTGNQTTAPQPPASGGERAQTSSLVPTSTQSPRVTARLERVAASRRRRRRRRDDDGASFASGQSCPLGEIADSDELALLAEQWARIGERLQELIGAPVFEVWFAGAHLHAAGDALELGVSPHTLQWVHRRFALPLQRAVDRPLELVGCAALAGTWGAP